MHYATADDTAKVSDSDYTAASGTLTLDPGQTAKSGSVLVNGDTTSETDEAFFVNLDTPTNATIADAQGVGTVLNDDTQPTITINDVRHSKGTARHTSYDTTFSLSNSSYQPVTVHYATADDTAKVSDSDYTAASGTLTFDPGQTAQTVTLLFPTRRSSDLDEAFFVNLDTPTNATIADAQGVGTVLNDDTQPTISINDVRDRKSVV